jgi:hypothetical protein
LRTTPVPEVLGAGTVASTRPTIFGGLGWVCSGALGGRFGYFGSGNDDGRFRMTLVLPI